MKRSLIPVALTSLLVASPSYAVFNLNSVKEAVSKVDTSSLTSLGDSLTSKEETQTSTSLLSTLTDSLGVTSTQAASGTGALLAYAGSALSSSQSSELTSLIPGLSALTSSLPSLGTTSTSVNYVNSIFSKLGMDTSMVSQFAPIIINYLKTQGASSELIAKLSTLWS